MVVDGGPWRGPSSAEWVERIARYLLRDGETLPLVKPLTAPVEEERAGGVSDGAEALPVSPAPSPSLICEIVVDKRGRRCGRKATWRQRMGPAVGHLCDEHRAMSWSDLWKWERLDGD